MHNPPCVSVSKRPLMRGVRCLSDTNNPRSQDLSTSSLPMELRDISQEITQHNLYFLSSFAILLRFSYHIFCSFFILIRQQRLTWVPSSTSYSSKTEATGAHHHSNDTSSKEGAKYSVQLQLLTALLTKWFH